MSSRSYQNRCGTWSAPGRTSICYLLELPGHPSHNVKGIRIVLRLALSLLINPALNWIQSSPSVQFQLCATLIEMVAGDGQQMQLLQTLRNRNGVSCASVLSRDWNMDFHCHLSSNSRGVNRSRSSVLRVHFLFACHTAQPGGEEGQWVLKRIADWGCRLRSFQMIIKSGTNTTQRRQTHMLHHKCFHK